MQEPLTEETLRRKSGGVLTNRTLSDVICDRSLSMGTWGHTYEALFLSDAYVFEETRGDAKIQLKLMYNPQTPVTLSSIPCTVHLTIKGTDTSRTLYKKRVIDLERERNLTYIQDLIAQGIPLAEVYTLL